MSDWEESSTMALNSNNNNNSNDDNDRSTTMMTTTTGCAGDKGLRELLEQRQCTIRELEKLLAERDARIRDLVSQVDKYRSVLHLSLPTVGGAPPTGTLRKVQRAWGISAEPQSQQYALRDSAVGRTSVSHRVAKDPRWVSVW